MYKVSKAKQSDFININSLLQELFKFLSKFSRHTFFIEDSMPFDKYKGNLNNFYVLKYQNKIVGVMDSNIKDIKIKNKIPKKSFFVCALVITESFRNQDGGSFLLNHVKKIREKIDNIRLRVLAKNTIAYNFYLKNGFKKISEILEYVHKNKKLNECNDKESNLYKAITLANVSDFGEIKALMKFKENRVIDTYSNILNDCTKVITKKEFEGYLKEKLIFIIKEKNKIIGSLGLTISYVNFFGFVRRNILLIDFLLIDKDFKKDNFKIEREVISSFINYTKEIIKKNNIQIIKAVIYPEQKSLFNILKQEGFHKFSYDMEKCL